MHRLFFRFCGSAVLGAAAQAPDEGYSREQLQPLTKFRWRCMRFLGAACGHNLTALLPTQAAAQENHRAGLRRITLRPRSCLALTLWLQ